jgi:hypothetical protein
MVSVAVKGKLFECRVSSGGNCCLGRRARQKPERLAEKLSKIRLAPGLSQNAMIKHPGLDDPVAQHVFTNYEAGIRELSSLALLKYSRAAGVHMEAPTDDAPDLPEKLPGQVNHTEISRRYPLLSRAKKR